MSCSGASSPKLNALQGSSQLSARFTREWQLVYAILGAIGLLPYGCWSLTQGCVLAPTLFNILLACILRVVYSHNDNDGVNVDRGIQITYRLDESLFNLCHLQAKMLTQPPRVLDLQYAVDAVLVDHSAEGLQMSLDALSLKYAQRVW